MGRKRGPVEGALWRELAPEVRKTALAQTAFEIARQIDDGVEIVVMFEVPRVVRVSARDMAALGRELRAFLVDLAKLQPVKAKGDAVDDLHGRRQARRSAAG